MSADDPDALGTLDNGSVRPFGTFRTLFVALALLPVIAALVAWVYVARKPDTLPGVCRSLSSPDSFAGVPADVLDRASDELNLRMDDLREPSLDVVSVMHERRSPSAMEDTTDADAVCLVSATSPDSPDGLTDESSLLLVQQHPRPEEDCFGGHSCVDEPSVTEICVGLYDTAAQLLVPGGCWRDD